MSCVVPPNATLDFEIEVVDFEPFQKPKSTKPKVKVNLPDHLKNLNAESEEENSLFWKIILMPLTLFWLFWSMFRFFTFDTRFYKIMCNSWETMAFLWLKVPLIGHSFASVLRMPSKLLPKNEQKKK